MLCKLGKVSVGDHAASVTLKIERGNLQLDKADECLCGRRLVGQLVSCREDEDPKQKNFLQGARPSITGVFDVRGFRVAPETYSTTLSFARSELNGDDLFGLANQTVRLMGVEVGELDDDEPESEGGEDEDESEAKPKGAKKRGREAAVAN